MFHLPLPITTEPKQHQNMWKCGDPLNYPLPEKDLKDNADHWSNLLEPLVETDKEQCKAWKEEIENLLLFVSPAQVQNSNTPLSNSSGWSLLRCCYSFCHCFLPGLSAESKSSNHNITRSNSGYIGRRAAYSSFGFQLSNKSIVENLSS